jgi:hypothetical protein
MSNPHNATDYTANGPTNIGFRTGGDNTGIENGVVATGTKIGVKGIGAKLPDSSAQATGVEGESPEGYGVRGHSVTDYGVVGSSDDYTGIRGDGKFGGVYGVSDSGFGVKGTSWADDGVVGSSSATGKSGVVGDNTGGPEGAGFGVSGHCKSRDGAGVSGSSDYGYGASFRGGRAPLRLEPEVGTSGPPRTGDHQVGEFFVDMKGELFFCSGSGTPGSWSLVQLIPTS